MSTCCLAHKRDKQYASEVTDIITEKKIFKIQRRNSRIDLKFTCKNWQLMGEASHAERQTKIWRITMAKRDGSPVSRQKYRKKHAPKKKIPGIYHDRTM